MKIRNTILSFGIIQFFLLVGIFFPYRTPSQHYSPIVYDRGNKLIQAQIASDGQWRFPLNDSISNKFSVCILNYEDQYFLKHPGFNPVAFARAARLNFKNKRIVSGGSTITMQLARLLLKESTRSYWGKVRQIAFAIFLELKYSKSEILAKYAEMAPFGGNVVGIETASWRYYGRSSFSLSWAETATLAVLPNSPSLIYPGKNQAILLKKRDRLLSKLFEMNIISPDDYSLAKLEPLPGTPYPLPQSSTQLLSLCKKTTPTKSQWHTTIDMATQKNVQEIINRFINQYSQSGINNAAALVANIKTGEVLAYVGNHSLKSLQATEGFVDNIQSERSTGSILKPFLYAAMLNEGQLLPHSLVVDIPTFYAGYAPQNYNKTFEGCIPASQALARSLNVPAVKMLHTYSVYKLKNKLQEIGMSTLKFPASHYGLSLILGGAEAKLFDLVGMYANFARCLYEFQNTDNRNLNNCKRTLWFDSDDILNAKDSKFSLSPSACWFTLNAMEELERPEEENGWKQFSTSKRLAWKTGTSFGYRDAWAIGLNGEYAIGVWVGNSNGEGREGLVGSQKAGPILFEILKQLPQSEWFPKPFDDMEKVNVCKKSGMRAGRSCDEIAEMEIPLTGNKSPICAYHLKIATNMDESFRLNTDCASLAEIKVSSWFVLPPVQEWYFKKKHSWYKSLPPYREDCQTDVGVPMSFIYPQQNSRIKIPIELDGNIGRVVLKIAHSTSKAKIYWHLDDQYLGSTFENHQLEIAPLPGKHVIHVVDDKGNTIIRNIEFIP